MLRCRKIEKKSSGKRKSDISRPDPKRHTKYIKRPAVENFRVFNSA